MTSARPSIAVIVPCRNMGAFLGEALESALSQTFAPAEVIVVDDGSTDNTRDVLARFSERVRSIDGPAKGSAVARNIAILASRSDLVAFLDADDFWRPRHLESAVAALEDQRFGASFPDWQHLADGQLGPAVFESYYSRVTEGDVFGALLRENWILTSALVVRRRLLAQSGLFDPDLLGGQDYDLWLRLARITEFAWVREPLAVKRDHGGNITSSPRYPYHHAKVWRALQSRHVDVAAEHRAYIRMRAAAAAYEAGRHAVRLGSFDLARRYLAEAAGDEPGNMGYQFWRALSALPDAVIRALLSAKRKLA